jgi:hypothetical protein
MDNWEDWDNDDYCVPNEEQLKKLDERKLIEESDNSLTKFLFDDDLAYQEANKYDHNNIRQSLEKNSSKKKGLSNKDANEQKQKERSKLTKEYKAKKDREKELFGEATENEYSQYEEMFY